MSPYRDQTEDLPAELAARLQRLADTQTAGSSPWPGVDLALHRARRRRAATVAGLAAVVLAGGVALGGLPSPGALRSHQPPPATRVTGLPAIPHQVTLEEAGYTGPTGGSLAGDQAWLAAFRSHAAALSARGEWPVAARDVHVLWAGDLGGRRYAAVLGRQRNGKYWNGFFLARAGTAAGRMTESLSANDQVGIPEPTGMYFHGPAGGSAVVLVVAPKTAGVEIATSRRFYPGGRTATTWRPLAKQGGTVWAGEVDAAEEYLASYRIAGPGGAQESGAAAFDAPNKTRAAAAIAAPGTPRTALDCASNRARFAGASILEQPVIATGRQVGTGHAIAGTVLRSPDGGYLWGICDQREGPRGSDRTAGNSDEAGGVSGTAFASPDAVMAAVQATQWIGSDPAGGRRVLVITPAGAVRVRAEGVSAPVADRLAIVSLPPLTEAQSANANGEGVVPVTVEALAADGTVIATLTTSTTATSGVL